MKHQTTVVFCLPGASFSGRFLECWTNLLAWCLANGIRPVLSRKQSCNIYYVRNLCLGGSVSRGPNQKPFNGQLDYDYIMWIDSDMVFSPQQFERLLGHRKDIVAGVYCMEGGKALATVEHWDEEYFRQHSHFKFMSREDLKRKEDLIKVSYTGMGFMLVKKGVFEGLDYPWFRPIEKRIGTMVDFCMEDVSFCLRVAENGFNVLIDPRIHVGHEKRMVL